MESKLNKLRDTRTKDLEVKIEYKVFEIPHKHNFLINLLIKQSINLKAATCTIQTLTLIIKIQKVQQWIIMDQKERTLSLIMNKIYNKSIKLLALKIYLIKILKFNKTRDKQIIKRKMRVDKIQEKFNFISQLKTICM